MLTPEFALFFADLAQNNNKPWFDAQRKRYEEVVKKPFAAVVSALQEEIVHLDRTFQPMPPAQLAYRINRDIRFSKDKSPYKTNAGAYFNPRGKKADGAGFYFHIDAENAFIACGLYELTPKQVLAVRTGIAHDVQGFQNVLKAKPFAERFGELVGERGKVIPAELKPAAEMEPRIYLKQFHTWSPIAQDVLWGPQLVPFLADSYQRAMPYHAWLNRALGL